MYTERLLYISSEIKVPTLPKELKHYVPLIDTIEGIQAYGIVGYCADNDVPIEQIEALIRKGKQSGTEVSIAEYKKIISQVAYAGIYESKLQPSHKVKLYAKIDQWSNEQATSLVNKEVSTFSKELEASEDTEFLFTSGIEPLDRLSGIPSNSLTIILAKTGTGKTSFMLSLANALALEYRIVYVSYEMSSKSVRYRAKHLSNLEGNAILLTGNTTLSEIEGYATEDTIIFIDYLALVPSNDTGEMRHKLTNIASDLLRLSTRCKAVITAHQANRQEKDLSLNSISEAYAVSWYASLVLGLEKMGTDYDMPGYNTVSLQTLKHRYGKADNKVIFPMNYSTLDIRDSTSYGDSGIDYEGVNW